MNFKCAGENLYDGLSSVSRALSAKGSLPVLSYILLTGEGGTLSLSATNLELSITTGLPADIAGEGSVCAPGRLFTDLISSIGVGQVGISVRENILEVESPNVKARLNGIASGEFPKVGRLEGEGSFSLVPAELSKAIASVVFSAAADESRPVLTGILFEVSEGDLVLVGVDGFRLSEKRLKVSLQNIQPFKVIIPAKSLGEIARLISAEDSLLVYPNLAENQISFKTPRYEISSRLIEGAFPDYKKIIPGSFITKTVVSTEEFRKGVKLASLFARDASNIIKMTLDPGKDWLLLSANTPEVGENETKLPAKTEGETLTIAFNNRYLSDILGAVASEEIAFQASGQLSPGLFTSAADEGYIHIIMPVRVQE